MKYKLSITRGNNINGININLNELKKIDEFTSQFNNEIELKNYLLQKKLIDSIKQNEILKIIYNYNKKTIQLPIVYSDTKKCLDRNLKNYIEVLSNDNIEFLDKFINMLQKDKSIIYKNINEEIYALKIFINDYKNDNIYNDSYIMRNEALNNIFKKYMYIKGKLNYNSCRKVALFISDYINNNLKKENNTYIQESTVSIGSEDDIYEEPIFPPNSEEEENYNKYLNSLNIGVDIEEHDHYKRM